MTKNRNRLFNGCNTTCKIVVIVSFRAHLILEKIALIMNVISNLI